MYMYLMPMDLQLWVSIEESPFIVEKIVDGVSVKKPSNEYIDNEIKKTSYGLKVRNILIV